MIRQQKEKNRRHLWQSIRFLFKKILSSFPGFITDVLLCPYNPYPEEQDGIYPHNCSSVIHITKGITEAIGVFIAADMRPYSVVQNKGFKHLMNVLEPRYDIPSCAHFSENVVPSMYEQQKSKVMAELSQDSSVALTTDGWISRAT